MYMLQINGCALIFICMWLQGEQAFLCEHFMILKKVKLVNSCQNHGMIFYLAQ